MNTFSILNGQIIESEQLKNSPQSDLIIYEVLRVIEYIPLFYEDHIVRLYSSCEKVGHKIQLNTPTFFMQLVHLSKVNGKSEGNLMVKVMFVNDEYNISAGFIPHSYPKPEIYKSGVSVGFLHAERTNPEAKIAQTSVREQADKMLSEKGLYEVLLVNRNNCITEGSRSNCILIKDNCLYTAPPNKVLRGITLLKVLEIAKELGLEVVFEEVNIDQLVLCQALFLTGTSPKILPVNKAENLNFDVAHPIICELSVIYDQLIADYVKQKKEIII